MPKTPVQSDEDRALAELQRRRERATSRPRSGDEDAPHNEFDSGDVTQPHQLIDVKRYQTDENYRRDWDEVIAEFQKNAAFRVLWTESRRTRRDSEGSARAGANAALHANADATKVDQFAADLKVIDGELKSVNTVLKITKWILGFVIAALLGGIITIATKIFDWGMSTGEAETRLQTLEKEVNTLEKQFDTLSKDSGKASHP